MRFKFDLSKYEDVKVNADKIYNRLAVVQDMPCDAPWPQSQLDLFKAWMDEGKKP